MAQEYISTKKIRNHTISPTEKHKSTIYATKECYQKIDSLSALTGKEARSQVIEDAVRFYHSYIAGELNPDYLCGIYGQKVEAIISRSTDRLARLLFKIAVNDNIIAKLTAGKNGMTKAAYDIMRQKAVQEVKSLQGVIDIYDVGNADNE